MAPSEADQAAVRPLRLLQARPRGVAAEAEQLEQKRELAAVIESFNRTMLLRPYSLMGTRADVELLLSQITESMEPIQQFATAVASTRMGGYLNSPPHT
jgi:chlorite dismutase